MVKRLFGMGTVAEPSPVKAAAEDLRNSTQESFELIRRIRAEAVREERRIHERH